MDEKKSGIFETILTRRSVRSFTDEPVDRESIRTILEAGSWAPSGLNNQPWRFAVLWDDEIKQKLSQFTRYGSIIKNAPVVIAVFLDHDASYNYVKDCQAIGACLQNMLLTIHDLGLGGVWIGEILKNKDDVRMLLGLDSKLELMAVVALGHPSEGNRSSHRKNLDELVVFEK